MSNVEAKPEAVVCAEVSTQQVQIIDPRNVPLGGLRAMTVRRTLPSRQRSLIGAWCFIDQYGPDDVARTGGMSVAPHPHIGLQTVSWLFEGEIEHRDSAGNHTLVRPGELNLMTAGAGISHSEVSAPTAPVLHGVQLWVALPDGSRQSEPGFAHHVPELVCGDGYQARVFLGRLFGQTSPVRTATPLLGAEIVLQPGGSLLLDTDRSFEHGILLDSGSLSIQSAGLGTVHLQPDQLAYLPTGVASVLLRARHGARLLVLGGPPFGEQVVMWWNFLARTQEEIQVGRREWQRQILDADGGPVPDSQQVGSGRFGVVIGDHLPPIPAPDLPATVRLRPRS